MKILSINILLISLGWALLELYLIKENPVHEFSPIDTDSTFYTKTFSRAARRLNPNVKYRHKLSTPSRVVFDAIYTTDAMGRRRTKRKSKNKSKKHVLFFGGSYTFGHGLNDNETIVSHLSQKTSLQGYNYGIKSFGTFNVLARINERDLSQEIAEQEGHLIYLLHSSHPKRSYGITPYIEKGEDFPVYQTVDGTLRYLGTTAQIHPIKTAFLKITEKSRILRNLVRIDNLVYRSVRDEKGDSDWALAVAAIKNKYLSHFPKGKFSLVIHPASRLDKSLLKKLEVLKIKVIQFGPSYKKLFRTKNYVISPKYDRHPSSNGNMELANLLIERLNLN